MTKKNKGDSEFLQISQFHPTPQSFPKIEKIIEKFREPSFCKLTYRKRFRQINQTLYELIQEAPTPSFLLGTVLDFFDRVNQEKVLNEPLDLPTFEFWLNHFSELSEQENYEVRAKIIGKYLPRDEYQVFFPIGMGKTYFGTHFSTAHLSPDVDTMIASFWGWIDSFGARVGSGLHIWCLPGGPPDSPITSVLSNIFGAGLFKSLARITPGISLTAMDLVTQKLFTKESGQTVVSTIDHGMNEKAVILVNDQGAYQGDWRRSDVELVRQIIILIKACLHWFENHIHTNLISLFAKADLSVKDLMAFHSAIFDVKIKDCEPAQDFNETQQEHLNDFFLKVFGVKNGFEGTFRDLNEALDRLSIHGMLNFQKEVETLPSSHIFDKEGRLKENRPQIFNYLRELIKRLDEAIFEVRNYVERLDVVLDIKYKVLSSPYTYITLRSEVDEIRQKMQNREFLTVIIHEQDGSLFPVGIVRANDLREHGLGTVSLRDFCNLDEVRMASYLEVISVIDHHKSALKTPSVPTAIIGDAQSCNVLISEQLFILNDKFSLGEMTLEQIDGQIKEVSSHLDSASQLRIMQRLLQKRLIALQNRNYYVDPAREFTEYFTCLHAILDDTDLLTKVSHRDLGCVATLLNRLKSLVLRREVEVIHFDDLPRDKKFVQMAAQRLLQQPDLYSLYKQIYSLRESEVESHLDLCIQGMSSNIFVDTKEQNGCARVGQTKMFSSNFPYFLKHEKSIRNIWFKQAVEVYKEKPEIDLHIHMISTIASAEEVYSNQIGPYKHRDELWFWTPSTQQGYNHLNSFLAGFQTVTKEFKEGLSMEFLGSPPKEFLEIFKHHFPLVPKKISEPQESISMGVLRFNAGAVNSRKSMITPFLPRLVYSDSR